MTRQPADLLYDPYSGFAGILLGNSSHTRRNVHGTGGNAVLHALWTILRLLPLQFGIIRRHYQGLIHQAYQRSSFSVFVQICSKFSKINLLWWPTPYYGVYRWGYARIETGNGEISIWNKYLQNVVIQLQVLRKLRSNHQLLGENAFPLSVAHVGGFWL